MSETEYVEQRPVRLLYGAIGAEDGQCAYHYPGIFERCADEAAYHTFVDKQGERQKVEICEKHVRDNNE